jgi:hypothetical protein
MGAFQFYFESAKQRKVGWVAATVFSWLKIVKIVKKYYEVVRYSDARASSFVLKVREEVFAHSHTLTAKHHSNMPNLLFGLPGRILREKSH